jgi:hypothetical protein
MSASKSNAKSKRVLEPLPEDIIKAIDEAHKNLKVKPPIESVLFQSQEAKDGFKQAKVVLDEGTLYEKYKKRPALPYDYDHAIDIWKFEQGQIKPTNTGRTERTHTQLLADMESRANHNRVVSGISDGNDASRRVADITHGYMNGERRGEYP